MSVAPGAVSNLTGESKFSFITLSWSAPQEPNGAIISYEVTYRVSDGNLVTTNTSNLSTTFTITSLYPGTNVTEISVRAYTSAGWGEAESFNLLTTLEEPRESYEKKTATLFHTCMVYNQIHS